MISFTDTDSPRAYYKIFTLQYSCFLIVYKESETVLLYSAR